MERAGCRDGEGAKECVREQTQAFALSITMPRKGTVRKPEAHPGLPKILAHPLLNSKQLVPCCSCRTQPLQFFMKHHNRRHLHHTVRPGVETHTHGRATSTRIKAPAPRALAGWRHAGGGREALARRVWGAARTPRAQKGYENLLVKLVSRVGHVLAEGIIVVVLGGHCGVRASTCTLRWLASSTSILRTVACCRFAARAFTYSFEMWCPKTAMLSEHNVVWRVFPKFKPGTSNVHGVHDIVQGWATARGAPDAFLPPSEQ